MYLALGDVGDRASLAWMITKTKHRKLLTTVENLGLPPDADGNGNYAFFDATNYAAILGRNYAELCSNCGIMLNALANELPKLSRFRDHIKGILPYGTA